MDIKHSRRILVLGAREAGALDVVKDLTGSAPQPDINGSTAGLTHEWDVQTAYYSAKVPMWIDEVPDVEAWKTQFLEDEAGEVVEAVGAWIYCYSKPNDAEEAMKGIQEVVERHAAGQEVVLLAVAKGKEADTAREENEDKCMEYGFEYIDYAATGKNEFGEKQGFERLKEALEANEWSGAAGDDDADLDELDFDEIGGFGHEEAEMTAELFGMKAALNDSEADDTEDTIASNQREGQVEDLDAILGKLLAIKEQSAGLPEQQRKRMAAQAVRDIMKENPNI